MYYAPRIQTRISPGWRFAQKQYGIALNVNGMRVS